MYGHSCGGESSRWILAYIAGKLRDVSIYRFRLLHFFQRHEIMYSMRLLLHSKFPVWPSPALPLECWGLNRGRATAAGKRSASKHRYGSLQLSAGEKTLVHADLEKVTCFLLTDPDPSCLLSSHKPLDLI